MTPALLERVEQASDSASEPSSWRSVPWRDDDADTLDTLDASADAGSRVDLARGSNEDLSTEDPSSPVGTLTGVVDGPIESTFPDVRQFVEEQGLNQSLLRLRKLAEEAFPDGSLSQQSVVEFDDVLGGEYLQVEFLVDPVSDYRERRREFMARIGEVATSSALARMVVNLHRHA